MLSSTSDFYQNGTSNAFCLINGYDYNNVEVTSSGGGGSVRTVLVSQYYVGDLETGAYLFFSEKSLLIGSLGPDKKGF